MNYSAILISIALEAARRVQAGDTHASFEVAVVFGVMALEALLNEQAFVQIEKGNGTKLVHAAVDRGAQGFDRFQAVLGYFFKRGFTDGQNPANDLKILFQIRNGFVHYRFERPPNSALGHLQDRGLFGPGWDGAYLSWPSFATPALATWAFQTTCDAANVIADILSECGEEHEAFVVRKNFSKADLAPAVIGSRA